MKTREELREDLEDRGLTYTDVASKAKVSGSTVSHFFSDKEGPSIPMEEHIRRTIEDMLDIPRPLEGVWDRLSSARLQTIKLRVFLVETINDHAHPLVRPGIEQAIEKLDDVIAMLEVQ